MNNSPKSFAPINVGFITPSVSRAAGGIFEIERRLAQELAAKSEFDVSVFSTIDEFTEQDHPAWGTVTPQTFPVFRGGGIIGFSSQLRQAVLAFDGDLLHLHALWLYTSRCTNLWRSKYRRPYVVTINGMLDEFAVRKSRWKKRLAWLLYEGRCLQRASILHVNTTAEMESVRKLGLMSPISIIPNGVDIPQVGAFTGAAHLPKQMLFLGRIHPKKNLTSLVKAWGIIEREHADVAQDWQLKIVGWNQLSHQEALQQMARELNCKSIQFCGPKFGADKMAALRDAHAFVLPSYSEGMPMAVLEAWAYGLPVLMTRQCNLPIGFARGAAIEVTTSVAELKEKMLEVMRMPLPELKQIGQNGRQLVKEKFCWTEVATQLGDVYRWLCRNGQKPETILE